MEPEAILIDLDGVLYTGDTPVPGAREAIGYLEEHGYPYRVVSNTTRSSRPAIASRLASLGFAIPASFIFTPAMAAAAAMTAAGRTRAAQQAGPARRSWQPGTLPANSWQREFRNVMPACSTWSWVMPETCSPMPA